MAYAVSRAQTVLSFEAAATLSAYRIVKPTTANHVGLWDTSTAQIIGVTLDDSTGGSDSSVAIVIAGTAKVACGASVSTGALVCAQTATGLLIETGAIPTTATSTFPKMLGIALQSGSTNSVIEVLLQIDNHNKVAW